MVKIPAEDQPIMITPEHSGGRWLLPIRDLRRSPAVSPNAMTPDEFEEFRKKSERLDQYKKKDALKKKPELEWKKGKASTPSDDSDPVPEEKNLRDGEESPAADADSNGEDKP